MSPGPKSVPSNRNCWINRLQASAWLLAAAVTALFCAYLAAFAGQTEVLPMRASLFSKLTAAAHALEDSAGADKEAQRALVQITDLLGDDLNATEESEVWGLLARARFATGDVDGAIAAYKNVLTYSPIARNTRLRTLRTLATLSAATGDWAGTLAHVDRWQSTSDWADPNLLYLKAAALYSLGALKGARTTIDATLEAVATAGVSPRPGWLHLLAILQNAAGDRVGTIATLRVVAKRLPSAQVQTAIDALSGSKQVNFGPLRVDTTQTSIPRLAQAMSHQPLEAVSPVIPAALLDTGLRGWVTIALTIDVDGGATNVKIIDRCITTIGPALACSANPFSLERLSIKGLSIKGSSTEGRSIAGSARDSTRFDEPALEAGARLRFEPVVKDGVPASVVNVRQLIVFEQPAD